MVKRRLIFVLIAIAAIPALYYIFLNALSETDLVVTEGNVVGSIYRILYGNSVLYQDWSRAPHAISPYGPVYYYLTAAVAATLQAVIGSDQIQTIYVAGRLVSFLAAIGTFSIIGLITIKIVKAVKLKSEPLLFFLPALLAFSVPTMTPWLYAARVDSLAVFLSISGYCCYFFSTFKNAKNYAIILFLFAFLTKQLAISAPLAVIASLLWEQKRKETYIFLGKYIIGMFGGIVFCHFVFGSYFWKNIIFGNFTGFAFSWPLAYFYQFVIRDMILLWAPLLFGFFILQKQSVEIRQISIYAVISLVVAEFGSSKLGSDRNYFIEMSFIFSILAATMYFKLADVRKKYWLFLGGLYCLVVFQIYNVTHHPAIAVRRFTNQEYVERTMDRCAQSALFFDSGLALRASQKYPESTRFLDAFNISYLAEAGKIDLSSTVADLASRKFECVVLPWEATSWILAPQLRTVFDQNYILTEYDPFSLYSLAPRTQR